MCPYVIMSRIYFRGTFIKVIFKLILCDILSYYDLLNIEHFITSRA